VPEPYSEADTRQHVIDQRLRLTGWNLDDPSQVI
jgi:predicted type IV restriction endonuclease